MAYKYDIGYTKINEINNITILKYFKEEVVRTSLDGERYIGYDYGYLCKCNKCNTEFKVVGTKNFENRKCPHCYDAGVVKIEKKKDERLGELSKLNCGATAKIVNYRRAIDIDVEIIETGEIITTMIGNFQAGNIKPKFYPILYGVGFIGNYKFKESVKKNKAYICWANMLKRCYCSVNHKVDKTYIDCEVCDDWHNFEIFEKWYTDNYYSIEGERICLDKDILLKGNKLYSPKTCIFAPDRINKIIEKRQNLRGASPIGVHKKNNRYIAQININGLNTYIGCYKTKEKAFEIYKSEKEKLIKNIADDYKKLIPKKLYDALYRWEVEIDD